MPTPELIPVPRSVFDDDFFRTGREAATSTYSQPADGRMPSARGFDSPDMARRVQAEPEGQAVVRSSPFAGATETPESDELDIPAFLRRGH